LPFHIAYLQLLEEASTVAQGKATGSQEDGYDGNLDDAVLQNANQFHKWHSELEAACATETEQKYQQYAQLLISHLQACESIQKKVCAPLE
jgi:hypothetical protein